MNQEITISLISFSGTILGSFISGVLGKWFVDVFVKNLEYRNAYFKEVSIKRIQYLEKMLDALDPLVTIQTNKQKDEILQLFFTHETLKEGISNIINSFSKRFYLEEKPKAFCDEVLEIIKNVSMDNLKGIELDDLNQKYKDKILSIAPNAVHMIEIQILEGHNIKAILKQAKDPRYKLDEEYRALKARSRQ